MNVNRLMVTFYCLLAIIFLVLIFATPKGLTRTSGFGFEAFSMIACQRAQIEMLARAIFTILGLLGYLMALFGLFGLGTYTVRHKKQLDVTFSVNLLKSGILGEYILISSLLYAKYFNESCVLNILYKYPSVIDWVWLPLGFIFVIHSLFSIVSYKIWQSNKKNWSNLLLIVLGYLIVFSMSLTYYFQWNFYNEVLNQQKSSIQSKD